MKQIILAVLFLMPVLAQAAANIDIADADANYLAWHADI